jgi:hypothetical protein
MIQRSYEKRPWWFVLFGDRIVATIAMLSLAPAIYAIWLVHQSRHWAGAGVGVAWLVSDSLLLVTLHTRRVVRITISVACTLVAVVAGCLVVFDIL